MFEMSIKPHTVTSYNSTKQLQVLQFIDDTGAASFADDSIAPSYGDGGSGCNIRLSILDGIRDGLLLGVGMDPGIGRLSADPGSPEV